MNFLAHVRVALAVSDDPRVLLGAILPDVEALVRQAVDLSDQPEVASGVELHKVTDAAFHDDPRFRAGTIALSQALQASGVGRGAARAVGHAGWELLLDGLLVDDVEVTDAFTAASAVLEALVAADDPATDRIHELARLQRGAPIWAGYRDPAIVAARLQRQLSHRPRLAFPTADLGLVTDGLVAAQPGIEAEGPEVIADITAAVLGHRATLPP